MIGSESYICKRCKAMFRTTVVGGDISFVVCPTCGAGACDCEFMDDDQEEAFERCSKGN